jgi:hypothetical protein
MIECFSVFRNYSFGDVSLTWQCCTGIPSGHLQHSYDCIPYASNKVDCLVVIERLFIISK